jgi:hypothetical protein
MLTGSERAADVAAPPAVALLEPPHCVVAARTLGMRATGGG